MTKLEELKAAFEAATPGEWHRKSRHEGAVLDRDGRTVAAACTPDDARAIALSHNLMPQLLEAVERVEAFQSVCSELTGMNPFLAGEFYKNKTVLEKLK